jgi:hypothetical protein
MVSVVSVFGSGTALATTPTIHSWVQGQAAQVPMSWHDGVCVVSSVGGNFQGLQESVSLTTGSDGNWHLSGTSATSGVQAEVMCVPWSAFTGSFTGVKLSGNWTLDWNGGASNGTVQINLWGKDSWCGVRGASGNFSGDLQDVALFQLAPSPWAFQVDAYSSQINGDAGCFGFTWPTSVTAKVSASFTTDLTHQVVELPPPSQALCGLTSVAGIYHTANSAAFIEIDGNAQYLINTAQDHAGDGEVASAQCMYYAQP